MRRNNMSKLCVSVLCVILPCRIDDIQDNAVLRRGIPAAHKIYGVSCTINAAKYGIVTGIKKVLSLNHPDATTVFTELVLDALRGQEMDIHWRDTFVCPSVEEYKEIVKRSKDRVRVICWI
jgi:geranylgeranyl diphosphate synthase type 3